MSNQQPRPAKRLNLRPPGAIHSTMRRESEISSQTVRSRKMRLRVKTMGRSQGSLFLCEENILNFEIHATSVVGFC